MFWLDAIVKVSKHGLTFSWSIYVCFRRLRHLAFRGAVFNVQIYKGNGIRRLQNPVVDRLQLMQWLN